MAVRWCFTALRNGLQHGGMNDCHLEIQDPVLSHYTCQRHLFHDSYLSVPASQHLSHNTCPTTSVSQHLPQSIYLIISAPQHLPQNICPATKASQYLPKNAHLFDNTFDNTCWTTTA
ncbi:hypothetical protein OTU49_004161 [Cherax quadricarinatus]|uniref:Uncharacterized protein n=1 Tax=Cherax quadricarinatus TaxID=27406 RepID=A0AAW0YND7_CHEQU